MNEIQVTIRGNVASELRMTEFDDGNCITTFRVASNSRRFDPERREWVTSGTTFFTINCRRSLAPNVAQSLGKGAPVLVTGRLRERAWEKDGRSGHSLEVEAEGLGHDLTWGVTQFTRVVRGAPAVPSAEPEAAPGFDASSFDGPSFGEAGFDGSSVSEEEAAPPALQMAV